MKTLPWALFALLALAAARPPEPPVPSGPAHYVVGLSPWLDSRIKDAVYRRLISLLIEEAPLGSAVSIYDAWAAQTITQIEIPRANAFRSAKTRANQFKEEIHALKEFLARSHPAPATNGLLRFDNALHIPRFLDFVADNLAAKAQPLRVVLLGSPLHTDVKEPGFSMLDGRFPSDAHLTASRDRSVYGLKDRSGALSGMTLHFGYFGDPWLSDVHQEKITRFWSLYASLQGGRLAAFTGDLPTLFAGVTGPSGALRAFEVDPAQTKLEMLRVTRDIGVADWITREAVPPVSGPPSIATGPMKIGIRWQGAIDLDLYAAPRAGGEMLFFEHTRSPEGFYFKDHRSSPDREFEFIEFEAPVDPWHVDASVNFYEGRAGGGASGEVRIEFDGKIYSGRFALAASRGNKGRAGANQRDFWTRINVPEILQLPPRNVPVN